MQYRLVYNSETKQVFLTFDSGLARDVRRHAKSIEIAVRTRMHRAVKDHEIYNFVYYGSLVKSLSRYAGSMEAGKLHYITVAEGWLIPKRLKLNKSWFSNKLSLSQLEISGPAKEHWSLGDLQLNLYVTYLCRKLRINPYRAHYAHLMALLVRCFNQESISGSLDIVHHRHWFQQSECYQIKIDRKLGLAILQIDDLVAMLEQFSIDDIYRHVRSEIRSLEKGFSVLDQISFEHELRLIYSDAMAKIYAQPMSILLGYRSKVSENCFFNESRRFRFSHNHEWTAELSTDRRVNLDVVIGLETRDLSRMEILSKVPRESHVVPMSIQIVVNEEQSLGVIQGFDVEWYKSGRIDASWLNKQMKSHTFQESRHLRSALDAISERRDLNGIVVLEGLQPVPFKGAFLKALHAFKVTAEHQLVTARSNEVVASIAFSQPGRDGYNVLGERLIAEREKLADFNVGEFAVLSEHGQLVAKKSGLAKISKNGIVIEDILNHQGDVNAHTGHIEFVGSVVIQGSIEAGAMVKATGDVEIKGSVAGGIVIAGGDIKVAGGIIVAKGSTIRCRGDLSAEFIENSKLIIGKSLTVNKAIMNSELYVGKSIHLKDSASLLAGGKAVFRDQLIVANLGRPSTLTIVRPGEKAILRMRYDISHHRLARVQTIRTELTKSQHTAKNEMHKTERKKLRFEDLTRNVERADQLVERIKYQLQILQETMDLDETSTCVVQGLLTSSVRFWKGDEEIVPVADYSNVKFLMRQSRGTHFVALTEDDQPKETKKEAS